MPQTDKLVDGYRRFREGYFAEHKDLLHELAEKGQSPKTAIISCCDSRVEPSIILDCDPGDLFVIRNVANLVPPFDVDGIYHSTSAALEFAVEGLKVENIIVLGHSQCGGIKALVDSDSISEQKDFVSSWMKQLEATRNAVVENDGYDTQEQRYSACEHQGIMNSLNNLMSFDGIKKRVNEGSLHLHGWYYDLDGAQLFAHDEASKSFKKVI